MKSWLTSGLFIVGVLHAGPVRAHEAHFDRNGAGRAVDTLVMGGTGPNEIRTHGEASEASFFSGVLAPLLANWPLVVVAIWGIIVARQALEAVAELSKSTRDAADAALANARAIANAQRPWVLIKVKSPEPFSFEFSMKNVGNTPALLISNFREIHFPEPGGGLPGQPPYSTESREGMQPSLLVPNEERPICKRDLRDYKGDKTAGVWLAEIENGLHEVYFFGRIQYADSLTVGKGGVPAIHETKWCYQLVPIPRALPLSHPYSVPATYIDYT